MLANSKQNIEGMKVCANSLLGFRGGTVVNKYISNATASLGRYLYI